MRAPEGWAILRKFHADPNDPNEFAAHKEFYQMKKQIELELKNATGHLSIFRTPAYRKRVYMSCFIQYAANATGALVINNYSIIMYKNLGLTGYLPLLMYCVYTLIGALGNLFSLLTIDKTGRRLEYMFVFFYGLFIDAASFIYSADILPTNIRSFGVAMATTTYFVSCITFFTPGATAIANIGYKYFVVFACLTLVSVVVVYLMYPETKNKSLKELAALFGNAVADRCDSRADS
ncbi:hypothetical protein HRS9139_00688 [Pyrenophora teres f. teres]|nr:hypothetical protein HRS9139_00688 [Pyrenophora teres f. teres]